MTSPNALTHRAQTLPHQPHAARSLLADRGAALHSPPGVGRVVHRVQENGLVGAGPLLACQGARPVAQRDQVGGPQVNARQEARQPRGGRHVVGQLQRRAHVLHGGLVQQPAQAHDLRRDAGLAQSGVNKGEILAAPTQDGDCAPLAILGRLRTDALHEVHRCGQRVLIHLRVRDLHGALPRSLPGNQDRRLCLERVLALLIGGHLTQGRCHAIRRVQNRHVVTPRGGQREGLPGLGRSALETIQEGLQGRGRGPPPPVNRLIRVAHRSNSVVAEQRGEELHLDDGRVLELIEEDRTELLAQRGAHRRGLAHDARGQDQLIRKIENAHLTFALLIGRNRAQECETTSVGPQEVACLHVGIAHLGQLTTQLLQGLARTLHREAVLGQLARKMQDLRNRVDRPELLVQVGGPRLDDLRHQVEGAGLGQHGKIGIDADPHPVLGHDALRERVVGQGHRVFVQTLAHLRHLS